MDSGEWWVGVCESAFPTVVHPSLNIVSITIRLSVSLYFSLYVQLIYDALFYPFNVALCFVGLVHSTPAAAAHLLQPPQVYCCLRKGYSF